MKWKDIDKGPQSRSLTPGPRCDRCTEQGWPNMLGCEPKCAFASGVFSSDNWCCATADELRALMGEHGFRFYGQSAFLGLQHEGNSYCAMFVPPHPGSDDDPDLMGTWDGGGLIAGVWYKYNGKAEIIVRVGAWDYELCGQIARPLTLDEAEAAIANCEAHRATTSPSTH